MMGQDTREAVEHHARLALESTSDGVDRLAALGNVGLGYMTIERFDEAIAAFEEARQLDTEQVDFPTMASLSALRHVRSEHEQALEAAVSARVRTEESFSDWRLYTLTAYVLAVAGMAGSTRRTR
jgi:hypothetical protein